MKEYKVNNEIRANEIMLIDAEGKKLGVMKIGKAVAISKESELDLVCINETSIPIVCKLMDYKKFVYDQKKKAKEMKKNSPTIETSEVRFFYAIQKHDLETKAGIVKRLIQKGNEVKLTLRLRGREETHADMAFAKMNELIELCNEVSQIKKAPYKEAREIRAVLSPKKD